MESCLDLTNALSYVSLGAQALASTATALMAQEGPVDLLYLGLGGALGLALHQYIYAPPTAGESEEKKLDRLRYHFHLLVGSTLAFTPILLAISGVIPEVSAAVGFSGGFVGGQILARGWCCLTQALQHSPKKDLQTV